MTCALMSTKAELEHRKQPDRPRADDHGIGLDRAAHPLSRRLTWVTLTRRLELLFGYAHDQAVERLA